MLIPAVSLSSSPDRCAGEPLPADARGEVRAAAGGERDHDPDRARGVGLRRTRKREAEREKKQCRAEAHQRRACRKRSSRWAKNPEWLPGSSIGSPIQKCGAPATTTERA